MFQKLKNYYHLLIASFANLYYRYPSKKLKIIGVTGTDGKTTTTHLIYHILKSTGYKTSMISSVYANISGKNYDTGFHVTTPDIVPLFKFLNRSSKAKENYFVLETTSHSLDQNRVYGLNYLLAVVTNITHEHLDYHKNYVNYLKTKAKLFKKAKIILINKDDESYPSLKKILDKAKKKFFTYGLKNPADFNIDLAKKLSLPLSFFNKYNYLAGYAGATLLGVKKSDIEKALKTFKLPPGRMEVVYDKKFKVIIDFAHTPNAIDQALSSIKNQNGLNIKRLIHVFASAGKRDASKRPIMGISSAKHSSIVILTEEDYRNENPQNIASDIARGLEKNGFELVDEQKLGKNNKTYSIILDRQKAINKAVEIAKEGDIVVITGKGHEKSLARGNHEYPWNEKEAVEKAVKNKTLR